jgi:hypothetical protein
MKKLYAGIETPIARLRNLDDNNIRPRLMGDEKTLGINVR